jgi:hypothetical protein
METKGVGMGGICVHTTADAAGSGTLQNLIRTALRDGEQQLAPSRLGEIKRGFWENYFGTTINEQFTKSWGLPCTEMMEGLMG